MLNSGLFLPGLVEMAPIIDFFVNMPLLYIQTVHNKRGYGLNRCGHVSDEKHVINGVK